ncbi:MAG: hypothetical protein GWO08_04985 [Gammaproteobacteria bacterium]|nr:hypothetical protein [Gammaproteobacteria bacterium]NIO63029.1 hypothetical protein [Gammaproteobacteria bacterium]NIP49024.1 hypothetical protein [Gammaproteobacteria bacterium]NIQ09480.1 hypothetical protein [Gammaproteobacteria bacterium]NIQ20107.1 hypothetical protein [Gammaproteobacteria bacterium]
MLKKSFKKIIPALLAALVISTPAVQAESPHEFSANVATTTDYRFRGISQSNEDFAIQGGFDYGYLPYNFYAGFWASSIEFGGGASTETNFYGGFTGEVMNGIGWDVGALYYYYPDNDFAVDLDYYEIYGSLSYDFGMASVTGGLAYSPDYFAESDTFLYYYGDVSVPLNVWGLSLNGHVGYNDIDDEVAFGTPSYTDYSFGVSKDIGAFTFDVSYVDTDLSGPDCFGGPDDICDSTVIFTVSAGF